MVFVVAEVTIISPENPSTNAHIAPGNRKIALEIAPAFVSGISFITDIMSIKREEYVITPYTINSKIDNGNTLIFNHYV